jgi:hypothetical protein
MELAVRQDQRMEVMVCEIGSDLEEEFIGKVVKRHGSRVV